MLPTPVHNFKATVEWINESLFYPDRLTSVPDPQKIATAASRRSAVVWIGGGLAIAGVIIGAIFTAQRSPQWQQAPTHSHQQQLLYFKRS